MPEAAEVLGISPEAVRARIHRGTLHKEKAPDGTVYVRLDADQSQPNGNSAPDQSTMQEVLREQIAYLRDQLDAEREANRENRRIIAGLIERVPALEAPQSGQEDTQEPPYGAGGVVEDGETPRNGSDGPSWWRRFFGLE